MKLNTNEFDNLNIRVVRPTPEDIEAYYQKPEISQSVLKYFLTPDGVVKYIKQLLEGTPAEVIEEDSKLYYSEKESFLIGTAADYLVTMGEENFYKKYCVTDIEEVSDSIKSIIHQVFDKLDKTSIIGMFSNYTSYIEEAITAHGYYTNRKMETNVNSIIDKGSIYFQQLVDTQGKIILTTETANKVLRVAQNYIDLLVKFIIRNGMNKTVVTLYFQKELIVGGKKGLLDAVLIDEETSSNIIIDFKSMYSYTQYFPNQVLKHRLDIQASWYSHLSYDTWSMTPHIVFIVSNTTIFESDIYQVADGCEKLSGDSETTFTKIGKKGIPSSLFVGESLGQYYNFQNRELKGWQFLLSEYERLQKILFTLDEVTFESVVEAFFYKPSFKQLSYRTFFKI